MNNRHIKALCDEHGIDEDDIPRETRVDKMLLAEELLRSRINKLGHGRWAIIEALKDVAIKNLGLEDSDHEIHYEPGYHECENKKNPLGGCVYDDDEDPCYDHCLYCGLPFTRK